MSDAFDPYYTWLGIPPEEQPANHYRLLGIKELEENLDAVENAADRQMSHVRTFQTGKHADLSQELLNEIAAARVTLLDPQKKAEYDKPLRDRRRPATKPAAPPARKPAAEPAATAPLPIVADSSRVRRPPKSRGALIAVIGGAAALAMVLVLAAAVIWMSRPDGDGTDTPDDVALEDVTQKTDVSSDPKKKKTIPPVRDKRKPRNDRRPDEPDDGPDQPGGVDVKPGDHADRYPGVDPDRPRKKYPKYPKRPIDLSAPPVFKAPTTHPVPSPDLQQQVLVRLSEIFDLEQDRTAEQKIKLAGELLNRGGEAGAKPEERFVMLRKSMELAREAGDAGAMLTAVDAIAAAGFEVDLLQVKSKVLASFAGDVKDATGFKSLLDHALPLADEARAARRYDLALSVMKAVHAASAMPAGASFRKPLLDRVHAVEETARQWEVAQKAQAALKTDPENAEANLALGRWHCLTNNDWRQGLPHLAKGSDLDLQQAAARELTSPPAEVAQMLAAADAWWDAAEKKSGRDKELLQLRAGHWYEQAQPSLSGGVDKLKVDKRLEEIAPIERPAIAAAAAEVKRGSPLPKGRWVDLMPFVPEGRDSLRKDGDLIMQSEKTAYVELPIHVEGGYDLQLDFTRDADTAMTQVALPLRERRCTVMLDYQGISGLGEIDGRSARGNATTRRDNWEPGKKYRVVAQVRVHGDNGSIKVLRDGERFLQWAGKLASLNLPRRGKYKAYDAPQMSVYRSRVVFHGLQLQLVSGSGSLLTADGKVPDAPASPADLLAEEGKDDRPVRINPLSFIPVGDLTKTTRGVYELAGFENHLKLARPIDTPWILEFDFVLPDKRRGFTVQFGMSEEAGDANFVTILPDHDCYAGIRDADTKRPDTIARQRKKESEAIRAGKSHHGRLMVKDGALMLLINNQPVLEAADGRIRAAGGITIAGKQAQVSRVTIRRVK